MRAGDQIQPVDMVELIHHLTPKNPSSPTRGHRPAADVLRIAPHEIAKRAFVWDFLYAVDGPDLVDGADLWAEAGMDAEDLVVDERGDDEVVEHINAVLPRISVSVLSHAFFIETIYLRNLATLVVTT